MASTVVPGPPHLLHSSSSPSLSIARASIYPSSCRLSPLRSFPSVSVSNGAQFRSRFFPGRIAAEATSGSGNDLDNLAAQLTEKASDAARIISHKTGQILQAVGHKATELQDSLQLQARLVRAIRAVNRMLEELSYDAWKKVESWDRRYGIFRRAQQAAGLAAEKARDVDQQFGMRQKITGVSLDLRRNWPTYKRRLDRFLQTPLGKAFSMLVFLWLLLSGWLFRIILLSMWILPLAVPLLLSTATRNAVVEGSCLSCKRRFIGNRSQIIICNYCKAIVWQPRQDFSQCGSDPRIIDIDGD